MTDETPASSVSVDDLLREHILPQDEVAELEVVHGGKTALLSVGRYGARLDVDRHILEFKLEEPDGRTDYFTVKERCATPQVCAELLALAWHKAAEAILAVRRGHREYNLRRKKERD